MQSKGSGSAKRMDMVVRGVSGDPWRTLQGGTTWKKNGLAWIRRLILFVNLNNSRVSITVLHFPGFLGIMLALSLFVHWCVAREMSPLSVERAAKAHRFLDIERSDVLAAGWRTIRYMRSFINHNSVLCKRWDPMRGCKELTHARKCPHER